MNKWQINKWINTKWWIVFSEWIVYVWIEWIENYVKHLLPTPDNCQTEMEGEQGGPINEEMTNKWINIKYMNKCWMNCYWMNSINIIQVGTMFNKHNCPTEVEGGRDV